MQQCSVTSQIGFLSFDLNADMSFFERFQNETGKCAMSIAMQVVQAAENARINELSAPIEISKVITFSECVKFLHLSTSRSVQEEEIKEQMHFAGPSGRVIDKYFFDINFDKDQDQSFMNEIIGMELPSFYICVYELAAAIVADSYVAFEQSKGNKKKSGSTKKVPEKLVDVQNLYIYLKLNKLVSHSEFYSLPYSAAYTLAISHHKQTSKESSPELPDVDWRNKLKSALIPKMFSKTRAENG